MDKILFEIKITNSCEEIKRLEILNDILKNVGADASFEKEVNCKSKFHPSHISHGIY